MVPFIHFYSVAVPNEGSLLIRPAIACKEFNCDCDWLVTPQWAVVWLRSVCVVSATSRFPGSLLFSLTPGSKLSTRFPWSGRVVVPVVMTFAFRSVFQAMQPPASLRLSSVGLPV